MIRRQLIFSICITVDNGGTRGIDFTIPIYITVFDLGLVPNGQGQGGHGLVTMDAVFHLQGVAVFSVLVHGVGEGDLEVGITGLQRLISAAIFEIHQMMLEDLDYLDSIQNMIQTQEVNAEYAVATTSDNFAMMFSSMDDAYMKERAADVKDVSERILAVLSGGVKSTVATDEPSIIVADDLAPSETVQLDKDKVLAFVTVHGSSNSHTH